MSPWLVNAYMDGVKEEVKMGMGDGDCLASYMQITGGGPEGDGRVVCRFVEGED